MRSRRRVQLRRDRTASRSYSKYKRRLRYYEEEGCPREARHTVGQFTIECSPAVDEDARGAERVKEPASENHISQKLLECSRRCKDDGPRRTGDHGEIGPMLPADGGDGEAVLAEFAKAGIDPGALGAQLQDEGAKSFVKSWNELMTVIASKSATLAKAG